LADHKTVTYLVPEVISLLTLSVSVWLVYLCRTDETWCITRRVSRSVVYGYVCVRLYKFSERFRVRERIVRRQLIESLSVETDELARYNWTKWPRKWTGERRAFIVILQGLSPELEV